MKKSELRKIIREEVRRYTKTKRRLHEAEQYPEYGVPFQDDVYQKISQGGKLDPEKAAKKITSKYGIEFLGLETDPALSDVADQVLYISGPADKIERFFKDVYNLKPDDYNWWMV